MNPSSRFRIIGGLSLIIALAAFVMPVAIGAPDPPPACTETGPHSTTSCLQAGSYISPVQLTWTNTTVLQGSVIAPPALIGPVFNPGKKLTYVFYDCAENAYANHYVTNDVIYLTNIVFTPSFPTTATNLGTNHYTMTVQGVSPGLICGHLTNLVFNLDVAVWSNGDSDQDQDGLPDWWEWKYFGNFDHSGSDLDPNGNTLLDDYNNGIDPNIIQFSIEVANNYVNNSTPDLHLAVTAGVPFYYTVQVDNTNYLAATNWTAYTSADITASIGSLEGWHELWVGVKGSPADATMTWQWKRLKLDFTPPRIVITSPTNSTVDVPMIQLTGYSPEALDHISYDLTNAIGLLTNQDAGITDQYYDTNHSEFTTNHVEALDIQLTNGINIITLHATDLAGNVTTTNFSYTVDYSGKTNPPVFALTWPTNGTQISGDSFTWDGFVNDPTVTLAAQIARANGSTNVVSGLVERNGKFWVEDIPLSSGTNALTLVITDVAGNVSVTNISVVQSTLVLTMDAVTPDSELWQPTVNLTGTISDPSQAVWVNGVKGHNNGDGTWSASDVPTTPGGTASFTISAYTPDEQRPDGSFGN